MITLNYNDRRPLYEQIIDGIEALVSEQALQPGEQVPSVRQLSQELSINPNTIQKAYAELERRGVLSTVKGRGSFVADDAEKAGQRRRELLRLELLDFLERAAASGVTEEEFGAWRRGGAALPTRGGRDE